ncbi:MAG: beta-lactamase [Actinomycetia bacterium]|nr:beta-lactamase [Actinomycetes bacterium]
MSAFGLLKTWPVSDPAVAVIGPGGVLAIEGPDDPRPWASVTKLVSAYTVLLSVQRGDVDLGDPAGPPGSTVRHLLAHASGVGPDDPAALSPPGRRRVYSNAGFEVLARDLAEDTFGELMAETVLAPLHLARTHLGGSPAHGITGPLSDLARFGHELLAPSLLGPVLSREAATVQFPGLDGILPGYGRQSPNDWGLGFEIRGHKSPHWTGSANSPRTFGHFGKSGSFLWVDPDANLACACLAGRDFGEWASVWPEFSDAILTEFA